jgi:hypothetical protein
LLVEHKHKRTGIGEGEEKNEKERIRDGLRRRKKRKKERKADIDMNNAHNMKCKQHQINKKHTSKHVYTPPCIHIPFPYFTPITTLSTTTTHNSLSHLPPMFPLSHTLVNNPINTSACTDTRIYENKGWGKVKQHTHNLPYGKPFWRMLC